MTTYLSVCLPLLRLAGTARVQEVMVGGGYNEDRLI